jgi:hydrogenase maturation factor
VFLVASVNSAVTTIDDRFCFTSIAGGTLNAIPENLTTTGSVRVTYEDGGDTVRMPFATLNISVNDANGSDITINGATEKSVEILTDSRGSATFTVQINTPPATGNATVTIASVIDPDVEPISVTVSSNAAVAPPVVP